MTARKEWLRGLQRGDRVRLYASAATGMEYASVAWIGVGWAEAYTDDNTRCLRVSLATGKAVRESKKRHPDGCIYPVEETE